jgi:hypothetical protein
MQKWLSNAGVVQQLLARVESSPLESLIDLDWLHGRVDVHITGDLNLSRELWLIYYLAEWLRVH